MFFFMAIIVEMIGECRYMHFRRHSPAGEIKIYAIHIMLSISIIIESI
jgi:hypothetical protein